MDKTIELLKKLKDRLNKAEHDPDDLDFDNDRYTEHDFQDGEDEQYAGLNITDDPEGDYEDAAADWLKENDPEYHKELEEKDVDINRIIAAHKQHQAEKEGDEPPPIPMSRDDKKPEVKRKSGSNEWQPHGEYTPEQEEKMQGLMDEGYSHREAERMSGAYRGPSDFQSALKHRIKPSQPSEKMMGTLKELAGHWLDRADKQARLTADEKKNPMKHAEGQIMQSHHDANKDYKEAYHGFLNSEELKGLSGRERHKAIKEFKAKWHEDNPDHKEKVLQAANHAREQFSSARKNVASDLEQQRADIAFGGRSEGMSAQEAAQHIGGGKTEEGYIASVKQDPVSKLAQKNPKLAEQYRSQLKPEQLDRLKRIDSLKQKAAPKVETSAEMLKEPGSPLDHPENQEHLNHFVTEHAPLINLHVNKLKNAGKVPQDIDESDLHMAGYHGLMDAAHKYDSKAGAKFSTYAGSRISGKMMDHIAEQGGVARTILKESKNLKGDK